MDDLDEFYELVGTAKPTFDLCQNLNDTPQEGCSIVIATGPCERTKQKCFICKKRFVICDCGNGMLIGADNVCVIIGDIKCPRIVEQE